MNDQQQSRADALTTTKLPDGSGFAVASLPLPQDHWLYASRCAEWDSERDTSADTPHPILTHAQRDAVVAAVRYAIRSATMCGQDMDFDPDALVLNAVYALCGPFSSLLEDNAASPVEQPAAAPIDTPTDREFALSAAICVHPKGVYGDEGGSMCCPITHTRDASFAPSPADERTAFESLKGAWQSMPPFDVFCAGWRAARAASANETGAEVAQWQSRLKDRSSPVVDHWVNISPDGAKTLMEKYADVYEVRALYTAPRSPAMAAEAVAIPDGWRLVRVNEHFDALIAALDRAESKGYLPDSIREEWENFACDENAPQPAQADARVGLTDEQIETLAHRRAYRYRHGPDSIEFIFNRHCLLNFARALLNGANHAE